MNYENLLIEADAIGVSVKELLLESGDGRIKGKRIAIRKDIPTLAKKATVLAEELGHYHTSTGNILDQSDTANRKQERKARLWAYDKMVGLSGIIEGYQHRCQSRYGLAEYLGVTEEFLQEAIGCYKEKYGNYAREGNYIITFEPTLTVIEKI